MKKNSDRTFNLIALVENTIFNYVVHFHNIKFQLFYYFYNWHEQYERIKTSF